MKIKGFFVILVLVVIIAFFVYFIGSGEKKIIENEIGSFSSAKEKLTKTNMSSLKRAVDSYAAEKGSLPDTLQDMRLDIPITTGKLDAWGTEIKYEKLSGVEFRLTSAGSDRTFGTDDDIIVR
ncbi:MAG: type II secretion system protein GspG [Candidatus Aminicenantes bacterium]|nr:type II secretion system protein GspG [Candidatus Aminicenantes bacterium]